ncbi:FusB/FusC family EF-G-binding protein [Brevibacillus sp. TJ4]|uniref:FusB/FusC family EF-G-binding protein n=1 Tax=Brevibacillus sp. TJ4 TaxID=3234853 RepID=UPI003BA1E834
MCKPFIYNHQYNAIKREANTLQNALRTVADKKVLESVRLGAQANIVQMFPDISDEYKQMLGKIAALETTEEIQQYMKELAAYRLEFPKITEKQIQKLFPKNKKLKVPDLTQIDFRQISYLSWIDVATGKLFIVYPRNDQFVGVEGKFSSVTKKGHCFVCNRFEELVMFTAISKKKPANSSPDYYKAVGNYLCMDGLECNKKITDTAPLESFIASVIE